MKIGLWFFLKVELPRSIIIDCSIVDREHNVHVREQKEGYRRGGNPELWQGESGPHHAILRDAWRLFTIGLAVTFEVVSTCLDRNMPFQLMAKSCPLAFPLVPMHLLTLVLV